MRGCWLIKPLPRAVVVVSPCLGRGESNRSNSPVSPEPHKEPTLPRTVRWLSQVRCQAQGASTGVVLAELRAMGASTRTLRTLYAGMGSSALCSAVIGALYLLAFYTVKRVGGDFAQRRQQQMAASAAGQQRQRQVAAARSPAATAAMGSQLVDGTTQRPPLNAEGTHPLVASLAGVSASIIASVFEAPSEWLGLPRASGRACRAPGGCCQRAGGAVGLLPHLVWCRCWEPGCMASFGGELCLRDIACVLVAGNCLGMAAG